MKEGLLIILTTIPNEEIDLLIQKIIERSQIKKYIEHFDIGRLNDPNDINKSVSFIKSIGYSHVIIFDKDFYNNLVKLTNNDSFIKEDQEYNISNSFKVKNLTIFGTHNISKQNTQNQNWNIMYSLESILRDINPNVKKMVENRFNFSNNPPVVYDIIKESSKIKPLLNDKQKKLINLINDIINLGLDENLNIKCELTI